MDNKLNSKIVIISILAMLLLSFIFLSVLEKRNSDLGRRNVWFLYFTEPKESAKDFAIENHSNNASFHWEIATKKNVIQKGDIIVPKNETKTIPVVVSDMSDKKITITVTQGNNKKEIYKNF